MLPERSMKEEGWREKETGKGERQEVEERDR